MLNMEGTILLAAMALIIAGGQVLTRKGALALVKGKGLWKFFQSFFNPFLLGGLALVLFVPFIYIKALSTIPLHRAFMFNSLSHIFVFLSGRFILKERAGLLHWAGLSLIAAGFILPGITGGPL